MVMDKRKFDLLVTAMVMGALVPIVKSKREELAKMGGDHEEWFDHLEVDSIQRNELVNTWNAEAGAVVDEIPFSFVDWEELERRVLPAPGSTEELEVYKADIERAKTLLQMNGYAVGNWTTDDVWRSAEGMTFPEELTEDDCKGILTSVLDSEYVAEKVNDEIADKLRDDFGGKESEDE
jgi:hypothetical protein